ncbi:acyl-CoA carboxylase epsilon subunit [Streptomyces sp. NPDC007205]|uniref:acyl-CoA carboxylase epsilon subunit n=1 Tax=Streptomyces sp. NPDC007205 TaxID=3154316 RepID=UPI0033D26A8E
MNPAAGSEVHVVRGRPTPEELAAALVALRALAAQRAGQGPSPGEPDGRRRRYTSGLRAQPTQRGPGVWRRSAWGQP